MKPFYFCLFIIHFLFSFYAFRVNAMKNDDCKKKVKKVSIAGIKFQPIDFEIVGDFLQKKDKKVNELSTECLIFFLTYVRKKRLEKLVI